MSKASEYATDSARAKETLDNPPEERLGDVEKARVNRDGTLGVYDGHYWANLEPEMALSLAKWITATFG